MNVIFKNFLLLEISEHKKLLEIRNDENIRNNMKSIDFIELKNHLLWIENLKKDKTNIYYCVYHDDIIVGAIYITNIDYVNKVATWGLYFKSFINPFISSISTYLLIEKIFFELNLEILKLEVNKLNKRAYKFDASFGFELYDEYKENKEEFYLMKMEKIHWNKINRTAILSVIKRKIDNINYKFIEKI